jgi:hypothetical protein
MNHQEILQELEREGWIIIPRPGDPLSVEEKHDILQARSKLVKRRDARIRRAITNALDWHEIAAFAGSGDPDHVEYKEYRAKLARETLERIIFQEINNGHGE